MFKSNFKYQQFSESIIKKVKDLGELFELLQNRSNFLVFKMAGILILTFNGGNQAKRR